MSATEKYHLDTKPACVLVDGPQETDGDGGVEWTVAFGDDGGEYIDSKTGTWFCDSVEAAKSWGQKLAAQYGLELVDESMAA